MTFLSDFKKIWESVHCYVPKDLILQYKWMWAVGNVIDDPVTETELQNQAIRITRRLS